MKLTALRQTKVHQRAHSFLNLNSTITYLHLNHFECTEFLLIVYARSDTLMNLVGHLQNSS